MCYPVFTDFTKRYNMEVKPMKDKHLRFGDFIRKKRLADPRELTMQNVADHLDISLSYMSAVENRHKRPFDGEKLEQLAGFLKLTEDETALMFDLASRENREVPYDIEETLMYEDVGDLIRYATRQSKAGLIKEEDWKTFIRQMETKKKAQGGKEDG
jgi:transcriptional regulator with XRE-family HTH domain